MSAFLRKYAIGSGADIIIPLVKRGVVDFAVGADFTPAAGDVKVSIDNAAAANIGTLPTATAMGNTAQWKFVFTNAELTGKTITISVADSATKAVEDQFIVIETYGNASALHPFDLATATQNVNVSTISNNAITAASIQTDAIDADAMAANAIDAAVIATGAITNAKFAAGAIDAAAIADGAIDAATFAAGAIDATAIATDAIGSNELSAAAVAKIWAQVGVELAAVPGPTASMLQMLEWIFAVCRNARTQTATTELLLKDDALTTLGTSLKSDDGVTFSRGEYS